MHSAVKIIQIAFEDGAVWQGNAADFQALYSTHCSAGSRNTHFGTLYDHFHDAATSQAPPEPSANPQPVASPPPGAVDPNEPPGFGETAALSTPEVRNTESVPGDVPSETSDVEDQMDAAGGAPAS